MFVDIELIIFGDKHGEVEVQWFNTLVTQLVQPLHDATFGLGDIEQICKFIEEDRRINPSRWLSIQSFLHPFS